MLVKCLPEAAQAGRNLHHQMDAARHRCLTHLLSLTIPTEEDRDLDGLSAEIQSLLADMHTSRNLAGQIDMLFADGKGILFQVCKDVHLFYPPSV